MKKRLVSAVLLLTGGIAGATIVKKNGDNRMNEVQSQAKKYESLFLLMNQWVKVKQEGKSLSIYLKNHGYKKIAIYGMSYVGETLYKELVDSEIEVIYGIDQREGLYAYIDIVTMEKPLPAVDAIVVSAVSYFDEIKEKLSKKVMCPIVSLEEILCNI